MIDDIGQPTKRALTTLSLDTLGLTDKETPGAFDALTRLAQRLFGASAAIITVVQEDKERQVLLSEHGLADPWKTARETPLSHSICRYVKRDNAPLVISDTGTHPLLRDCLAGAELDIVAYLGVPIHMPDGAPIGAICVTQNTARAWSDADLAALNDLARCVNDEILLRAALITQEQTRLRKDRYNTMRESISLAFMAPDLSLEDRYQQLLKSGCHALGVTAGRIVRFDCGVPAPLFIHDPTDVFARFAAQKTLDVFTQTVTCECANVHFHDLAHSNPKLQFRPPLALNGCYAGTPLIVHKTLFGAIEFACDVAKTDPWSAEDQSILSIVSMFATAHLELCGQVSTLQNSERALIEQLCFATQDMRVPG